MSFNKTYVYLNAARGNRFTALDKPCKVIEAAHIATYYVDGSLVLVDEDGDAVVVTEAANVEAMLENVTNALVKCDMYAEVAKHKDYIDNFKEYYAKVRVAEENNNTYRYAGFVNL